MQGGFHGKIVLFFIASLLLTSCASTTSGKVSRLLTANSESLEIKRVVNVSDTRHERCNEASFILYARSFYQVHAVMDIAMVETKKNLFESERWLCEYSRLGIIYVQKIPKGKSLFRPFS